MDALKAWVRDIAVLALVLGFAEMLLPRNSLRRFAGLVIGLVLIAAILGSLVDMSLSGGDIAPPFMGAAADIGAVDAAGAIGRARAYAALGDEIARAGLEAANARVRDVVTRQVESLARLASGAERARAEVGLGQSGELAGIDIVLDGLDPDGAEAATARAESAVRDFYGLHDSVRVSVSARSPSGARTTKPR